MDDIENESYSSKSVPFPSDDEGRTIAEDSKASDMEETVDNSDGDVPAEVKQEPRVTVRSAITLGILVFINLLNYMDRYTLAGVLTLIRKYFDIHSETAGLLQTVFTCSYMVFAPFFGYLGDRYSRKYVMAVGVMIWSVTTFLGSLVHKDQLVWFFVIRGLVGIGEASYSTVAPTIIADIFVGDKRTKALTLFYFAIPCGSGLGYIVGSKVAEATGNDWQSAFRVTPGFGVLCVFLCIFVIHEPKRGAIETDHPEEADLLSASLHHESSSYLNDIKYLLKVKSFIYASLGFTCVSFVTGSLAFWAPEFVTYSQKAKGKDVSIDDVSYIFGIITFVTGVIGVSLGSEISRRYRRVNRKSDAIVCGCGIFFSIPFLFFSLYLADKLVYVTWVLIALGEILLCLNWAPNADLLLYVIVPNKRSTAEAVQILFIHLFGDAISPFIIGAIADAVQGSDKSDSAHQTALLYGLLITPFISLMGSVCYIFCARYLVHDREVADRSTKQAVDNSDVRDLDSLPPRQNSDECLNDAGDTGEQDTDQLIPDLKFSHHSDMKSDNAT